jgi:hypothetical protein
MPLFLSVKASPPLFHSSMSAINQSTNFTKMSQQTKNFINGAFLTKNPKYDIINLDFYPDFLDNLAALPQNEKGIRKVQLSAQKNDKSKWSIFENDFVPDPSKRKSKPGDAGTDDLPF